MSHQITNTNGRNEIVCGSNKAPWHGLGTVVDGLMTAEQAMELAGLGWMVEGKPVTVNGIQLPFPTEESSDGYQGICRSDTGACLGITKGRYKTIQNKEAFNFFDSLIGQGKAVYDTAGSLNGGKQVWLLSKVNGIVEINGDEHKEYALMVTSHDGSTSLQVSYVFERVVCANTLSVALSGQTNVVKIRHTSTWKDKEEEAARILGVGQKYYSTIQEELKRFNSVMLNDKQLNEFNTLLLTPQEKSESNKQWFERSLSPERELPTRTINVRDEINRLFHQGDGNKGQTGWDALNAVTDYVDHHATLRGENSTRLQSALMGSGASLKQTAYNLLTDEDLMNALLQRNHTPIVSTTSDDFARLLAQ